MGFLQDITGKTAADAARDARNSLNKAGEDARGYIDTGLGQSVGAVTSGNTNALQALLDAFNRSNTSVNSGVDAANGVLDSSTTDASNRLNTAGTTALNALNPLSDLASKYGAGTSLYLDSLGVNGQTGNQNAVNAFQAGPGYSFTLNQGLDAINRRQNAAGMLASGNADRDAINYATGLADQTYKDWQTQLAGLVNPELSATSTAATTGAGINRDIGAADANLLATTGKNKATLEASRGSMLSDLAQKYGTGVSGVETGQGNTLASLYTGAAGNKANVTTGLAQPVANTFGQEAAAWGAGSGNLLNLGMSLANLAAGGFGGSFGSAGSPLSLSAPSWGTGSSSAGNIGGTGLFGFGGLY